MVFGGYGCSGNVGGEGCLGNGFYESIPAEAGIGNAVPLLLLCDLVFQPVFDQGLRLPEVLDSLYLGTSARKVNRCL